MQLLSKVEQLRCGRKKKKILPLNYSSYFTVRSLASNPTQGSCARVFQTKPKTCDLVFGWRRAQKTAWKECLEATVRLGEESCRCRAGQGGRKGASQGLYNEDPAMARNTWILKVAAKDQALTVPDTNSIDSPEYHTSSKAFFFERDNRNLQFIWDLF